LHERADIKAALSGKEQEVPNSPTTVLATDKTNISSHGCEPKRVFQENEC
jgi:hypothetical protein